MLYYGYLSECLWKSHQFFPIPKGVLKTIFCLVSRIFYIWSTHSKNAPSNRRACSTAHLLRYLHTSSQFSSLPEMCSTIHSTRQILSRTADWKFPWARWVMELFYPRLELLFRLMGTEACYEHKNLINCYEATVIVRGKGMVGAFQVDIESTFLNTRFLSDNG